MPHLFTHTALDAQVGILFAYFFNFIEVYFFFPNWMDGLVVRKTLSEGGKSNVALLVILAAQNKEAVHL